MTKTKFIKVNKAFVQSRERKQMWQLHVNKSQILGDRHRGEFLVCVQHFCKSKKLIELKKTKMINAVEKQANNTDWYNCLKFNKQKSDEAEMTKC